MKRRPRETQPPTYTAGEVAQILKEKISQITLQKWDEAAFLRPSYYQNRGGLISRDERDAFVKQSGKSRGNPERRYTYQDLLWLRLLLYVKEQFEQINVPNPSRRSAEVVARIRAITDDRCPSASRLLFTGGTDVYFLDDRGNAERLRHGGQLGMRTVLTDAIFAEVTGRIAVLEAQQDIRALRRFGT